jgi:hypothetical protein
MPASDLDRFAIIPIYNDSFGNGAVPQDAVFVGSRSAVMERIVDSRARRDALSLINDAAHAKGELKGIRERERAVAAREEAVQKREDAQTARELHDALRKLDATVARFDAFEAERTKDPEDDLLPLPPGSLMPDDGELESPKAAPPEDPNAPVVGVDTRTEDQNSCPSRRSESALQ